MEHEFSKDKKNIYYNEEIIKGANIKTHQVIKYDYSKDKNNVYSGEYKIKDANPQTFKVLSECYSKDDKSIFYGTTKVNVDINNFKIKNHHIWDKKKAFCGSQEIKAIDIKTFEIIGLFIVKDKNYVWDEEDVISRANPKTFEIIKINDKETSYWKDDCHIWYDGKCISANPDTFELLNEYWSKDDYSIFYWGERISNIDIKTFQVIDNDWGKDKNGTYYRGRKLVKRDLVLETIRNLWIEYPSLSFTELFCKTTKIKSKQLINLTDDKILEYFEPFNNFIKIPNSNYSRIPSNYKINWEDTEN